jgi:glycosyltransferase involved in cell wall biosynthesis
MTMQIDSAMRLISILVPAYNEESTIQNILEKVCTVELHGFSKEVIVVNDCSKDETENRINDFISRNPQYPVKYFKHEVNKGKGAAIHTGIQGATGEYLIIQDADLELNPEEINYLLNPVIIANADVVYGSRFAGGRNARSILTFVHQYANKLLTKLTNICCNLSITDMETCYKLIRTDIIKKIPLKEKRFGFEPEVTAKLAKIKGIKIFEVGISYYARGRHEGKKIGRKDAIRAIICIIKYGLFKIN